MTVKRTNEPYKYKDEDWHEMPDAEFYHWLHFNPDANERYTKLCEETANAIYDQLTPEQREWELKRYLQNDSREGSPKELLLFLESSEMWDLVEKCDIIVDRDFKEIRRPTR